MWWQWLIFALIIIAIPYGLYNIKKLAIKRVKPTKEQESKGNQRFFVLCLFYWLCDFFYMTFIINNLTWRFILGGLIMVIVFYNLSKAFISGNKVFSFGLIQDFIVGISLTIYLIYIIPNKELQEIIIPIIAAVYGGLLTLVGVAWTIKDGNKKRQEELKRVENERKDEERKKYRPFVNVYGGNNLKGLPSTEPIMAVDWLKNTDEISNARTENLAVENNIRNCCFSNTDFASFYVYGIMINGAKTSFKSYRYIRKGIYFQISFARPVYTKKPIEEISLILEDMLGNLYELKLDFSVNLVYQQIVINGNEPSIFIGKKEILNKKDGENS